MINVVCAILIKEETFLATRRGHNMDNSMKWEFPGGKVEDGETEQQAIVREIKEELGLNIIPLHCLKSVVYDYGDRKINLIPFVCRIHSGSMMLYEHHDYQWVTAKLANRLDWAEADQLILNQVKMFLKR